MTVLEQRYMEIASRNLPKIAKQLQRVNRNLELLLAKESGENSEVK